MYFTRTLSAHILRHLSNFYPPLRRSSENTVLGREEGTREPRSSRIIFCYTKPAIYPHVTYRSLDDVRTIFDMLIYELYSSILYINISRVDSDKKESRDESALCISDFGTSSSSSIVATSLKIQLRAPRHFVFSSKYQV